MGRHTQVQAGRGAVLLNLISTVQKKQKEDLAVYVSARLCLHKCSQMPSPLTEWGLAPRLTTNVSAKMVKARKWVLRSHFVGQPKREDLEIVEEELPPVEDGGQS